MLNRNGKIVIVMAAIGAWQAGSGIWIHTKAVLAQVLLERAWSQSLSEGRPVRPWPWADTWPVARLQIPSRDLDLIVLQGDSGRSLAFGPGLAAGSARPGAPGSKLISAHRDTHFQRLAEVTTRDIIRLETTAGRFDYRIEEITVIDSRHQQIPDNPLEDELILATCYPFDALQPGGPLRYLIRASRRSATVGREPAPAPRPERCCTNPPLIFQD